jgi:acyl-CoA synthetase (AMP-forming)/AMP-acid ligase II
MTQSRDTAIHIPSSTADSRELYNILRRHDWADVLSEHARSRPREIAVVDGDRHLTFSQLRDRVDRLTWILAEQKIGAGDRILWLGQNSFRVLEVFLAAAQLGAVLAPANWRLTAAEIMTLIDDFDPKVVFWQAAEIGDANRTAKLEGLARRIWIQHDGTDASGYETMLVRENPVHYERNNSADLPALGIFTASFDGRPNAAQLSQNALMLQSVLMMYGQHINERSSFLVSGPMFHIGVLQAMFATFMAGGRCVFLARVDAQHVLELIQSERVTHAYIVAPTLEQMRELNRDGAYDVSSLFEYPDMRDWAFTSVMPKGSPMLAALGGYGQTELAGLAVMRWYGGTGAGRPGPFMQVVILNEDGEEVPTGEVGEICARGPMVMSGYYNRHDENIRRSRHGWHRTHDLGYRKDDGSIVFVGPKTTMIKSGLENIYPAEVENCIRAHPAIQDVCVIGVPDERWSQSVKAVVVLKERATVTESEIIEHCKQRIASYRKPKSVAIVEQLPRSAAGFVDRAAVDAAHGGGGYPKMGA